MFNSQSRQDEFVLIMLKNKKNGYFLEIGSNDAKYINNTYVLEKEYNWTGIMVEYDSKYEQSYKEFRPNSNYIISDARIINYKELLEKYNAPLNIDYLQIDLEVDNRSTLDVLEILDKQILNTYKFAVITFEHDIYRGNFFDTREKSRQIFKKYGYYRVFEDVKNSNLPYEDWYVHPSLVDIDYIAKINYSGTFDYSDIIDYLNII